MSVFVLDQRGQPLMPCSEKRARKLLDCGRARVHRVVPFVIRLTDLQADSAHVTPLALKIDPGSQTTGLALAHERAGDVRAVFLAEIEHRAAYISRKLYKRKLLRKARRGRHCRYRKPRGSRKPPAVPPSIQHRIENIATWVRRLRALAPVGGITWEEAGFDPPPALRRPDHERGLCLRDRLARRHGRSCAYCGRSVGPLEADHVRAKSRAGSDSVDNRLLTCRHCNERKGSSSARAFTGDDRALPSQRRLAGMRDAAAMNRMRRLLADLLQGQGLPATAANAHHTAHNRAATGLAKRDAIDALLLGKGLRRVKKANMPVLEVRSTSRGSRVRVRNDRHGFPRAQVTAGKRVQGFATGDLVRVMLKDGQAWQGPTGRVAVRASGDFNVRTAGGVLRVRAIRCVLVQRADGYSYRLDPTPRRG